MKKNLNEMFDGMTPEELDKLSVDLNAEELPDEVMSSIKGKVYDKTNIAKTVKVKKEGGTPRAVWLRAGALAACFAVIIGAIALFPNFRKDTPDVISPDGEGGATTTTTTTTTAKDYTPKKIPGFSSGSSVGSGEPPITVDFNSVEEIQAFIKAANGTEEEFEKYRDSKEQLYYYVRTQEVAQAMAHNMSIINLPIKSLNTPNESFHITYYLSYNYFDVVYGDGVYFKYRFTYFYNTNTLPKREDTPIKENVALGPYSLDLYEGEFGRLIGGYLDNSVYVSIWINAQRF